MHLCLFQWILTKASFSTFETIGSFMPITLWVLASKDNQPGFVIDGLANYFMTTCHHGNTDNVIFTSGV
jgi:hypothetical protein